MTERLRERAFTLVELMLTVGLMALLGTISTVGYFAASRGMADSGVRQSVISLLRISQQRALIDNRPVVVFIYNQTLREEDQAGGLGDVKPAASMGAAVAVRMAGRITYAKDGMICDEFANWHEYPKAATSGRQTQMRLYRIPSSRNEGVERCRSFVSDYVAEVKKRSEYLLSFSEQVYGYPNNSPYATPQEGGSVESLSVRNAYGDVFAQADFGMPTFYGFEVKGGYTDWKVGDPYGFEIASLQLPSGYTFDKKATKSVGIDDCQVLVFNPEEVSPDSSAFNTSVSIQIKAVGTGDSSKLRNVGTAIGKNDLRDRGE